MDILIAGTCGIIYAWSPKKYPHLTKIGKTIKWGNRKLSSNSNTPFEICLRYIYTVNNIHTAERVAHNKLKNDSVVKWKRGSEWFYISSEPTLKNLFDNGQCVESLDVVGLRWPLVFYETNYGAKIATNNKIFWKAINDLWLNDSVRKKWDPGRRSGYRTICFEHHDFITKCYLMIKIVRDTGDSEYKPINEVITEYPTIWDKYIKKKQWKETLDYFHSDEKEKNIDEESLLTQNTLNLHLFFNSMHSQVERKEKERVSIIQKGALLCLKGAVKHKRCYVNVEKSNDENMKCVQWEKYDDNKEHYNEQDTKILTRSGVFVVTQLSVNVEKTCIEIMELADIVDKDLIDRISTDTKYQVNYISGKQPLNGGNDSTFLVRWYTPNNHRFKGGNESWTPRDLLSDIDRKSNPVSSLLSETDTFCMYLKFMFTPDGCFFKIGYVDNAGKIKRTQNIQTVNFFPVNNTINYVFETDNIEFIETNIQRHFVKYLWKNEWFMVHGAIQFQTVHTICAEFVRLCKVHKGTLQIERLTLYEYVCAKSDRENFTLRRNDIIQRHNAVQIYTTDYKATHKNDTMIFTNMENSSNKLTDNNLHHILLPNVECGRKMFFIKNNSWENTNYHYLANHEKWSVKNQTEKRNKPFTVVQNTGKFGADLLSPPKCAMDVLISDDGRHLTQGSLKCFQATALMLISVVFTNEAVATLAKRGVQQATCKFVQTYRAFRTGTSNREGARLALQNIHRALHNSRRCCCFDKRMFNAKEGGDPHEMLLNLLRSNEMEPASTSFGIPHIGEKPHCSTHDICHVRMRDLESMTNLVLEDSQLNADTDLEEMLKEEYTFEAPEVEVGSIEGCRYVGSKEKTKFYLYPRTGPHQDQVMFVLFHRCGESDFRVTVPEVMTCGNPWGFEAHLMGIACRVRHYEEQSDTVVSRVRGENIQNAGRKVVDRNARKTKHSKKDQSNSTRKKKNHWVTVVRPFGRGGKTDWVIICPLEGEQALPKGLGDSTVTKGGVFFAFRWRKSPVQDT